jgi:hypothetical protein
MGCSRQLVGVIENGGNMSVDQLAAYCLHGRVSADEIVFGTPAQAAPHECDVARQFAAMDPWLRTRLWALYQVFVRPRSLTDERTPTV